MIFTTLIAINIIASTSGGCSVKKDIALVIDESGSVTTGGFQKQLTFLQKVVSSFTIGDDSVLVGAVAFSNTARTVFNFKDYKTTTDVVSAVGAIDYIKGGTSIGNGIDFTIHALFTSPNGDRDDVENHMLIITDGNSADTSEAGMRAIQQGYILSVIGVDNYNYNDWILATVDPGRIFLVPDYNHIETVLNDIIELFECHMPNYCGQSVFGHSSDSGLKDNGKDEAFLLAEYEITCCGVITVWEFVPMTVGKIHFHVWRQDQYSQLRKLVAFNTYNVEPLEVGHVKNFTVPFGERIAVIKSDLIGLYSKGPVIPMYTACSAGNCHRNLGVSNFSHFNVSTGSLFDWGNTTELDKRMFPVRFYTENNTEPYFSTKTSTLLPDHTPVGGHVTDIVIVDPDQGDINNCSLNHTYFRIGDANNIVVRRELPRMYAEYILVVTSVNVCEMTSSSTLTVTTFNSPPKMKNMPRSVTIRDDIMSRTRIFDLDISDDSGDDMCCTLSSVQPDSGNFRLEVNQSQQVYSIYTVANPEFNRHITNFYRITICCSDGLVVSTNFLDVKVVATAQTEKYVTPVWFMSAVVAGLIPISMALVFACIFICDNMLFAVEKDDIKRE